MKTMKHTRSHLCIRVPKFNSNIPFKFILKSDSQNFRDSLHYSRFSVSDMPNRAYR